MTQCLKFQMQLKLLKLSMQFAVTATNLSAFSEIRNDNSSLNPFFQLFELRLWRGFVAFQLSQVHNASVKIKSYFSTKPPQRRHHGTTFHIFFFHFKAIRFFSHRKRRKSAHHAASASLRGASGSNGSELIGSGVSRAVLPKRAPAASSVAASWANSARSFPRRSASLFDLSWEDAITVQ